jgi:hypothetical protein
MNIHRDVLECQQIGSEHSFREINAVPEVHEERNLSRLC